MDEKKSLLLEGLLPTDVWNALIVIIVLFGVFVAVFKGVVLIRDEMRKHKDQKAAQGKDFTERIADKVMEQLAPQMDERFEKFESSVDKRLEDIDKKLGNDKAQIESHTTQINGHERRISALENGNKSLCQGILALLEANPALAKPQKAMKNYLINGTYNEEDWK